MGGDVPMEWGMDVWKFYDITHRRHLLCNPTSAAKIDGVIELLNLERDARVVDIPELIEELADLRERGLLTEREFQAKKRELLNRI